MTVEDATLVVVPPASLGRERRERLVSWRRLARVARIQHSAALAAVPVVLTVLLVVIGFEQEKAGSSYASFVAGGCVAHPFLRTACNADALGLQVTPFTTLAIVLRVLPLLVGVFIGAPLLARELESGTYRFAWTQGAGRVRVVLVTFAVLAGVTTASAAVLGLVFGGWYAHELEVVVGAIESTWQSGPFLTTWWMLATWTLFALALGTFLGAAIKRTVSAMAATAAVVGGLYVAASAFLPRLLAIGALASSHLSPVGMNLGSLGRPPQSSGEGPPGSWLVRSWFAGPGRRALGPNASARVYNRMLDQVGSRSGGSVERANTAVAQWLSLHHYTYWVAYQPASHLWAFQAVVGVIMLALAALCGLGTVRCVQGRPPWPRVASVARALAWSWPRL